MTQQFDLFGAPVLPALPKRQRKGPDGPTVKAEPVPAHVTPPVPEAPPPAAPSPEKPASANFNWETATPEDREYEVLCWFVAQCGRGATAEEASAAFGRDLGVLVAARGQLEDTGRVYPRNDGRTFARMLRAARIR